MYNKESQDILIVDNCELCYECVDCYESYRLFFSSNCSNCVNSSFLFDCQNCQDCFGCSNLRNKNYCFMNEQLTKEEYERKIEEVDLSSRSGIQKVKEQLQKEGPTELHRFAWFINCVECTGNHIRNSKGCKYCFDVYTASEDSKYSVHALNVQDCYSSVGVYKIERGFQLLDCNVGTRNKNCITTYSSNDMEYCINCHSCSDCFGCIGLQSKQYCIFNKQYDKDSYFELKNTIIQAMDETPYTDQNGVIWGYGSFFPVELSPFGYNETIAQEYFPTTKEEAHEQGFRWRDRSRRDYTITVAPEDIPDSINEVDESIVNEVIGCAHKGECNEQCMTAFKILPVELKFYQQLNLPLPNLCFNCRHYQRLKQRTPVELWHRQCMCERDGHEHNGRCPNEFDTSYSPDGNKLVYCDTCYQNEVL